MVEASAASRAHIMHVVRRGVADGGMENGIVNVANLLPQSYRVSVCALDSSQTFSQRIARADSEFPLQPKRGSGIDWGLVGRLAQQFRGSGVDVVHSHNWGTFLYSVLAARRAGIPIVHGEHGKNPNEVDGESLPKRWTKRILGRRTDRIVTVSKAIADEWVRYGVAPDCIRWIPNGVDVERFRPRPDKAEQRKRFALPSDAIVIGSVGRLDSLKNYEVLVAALARMKRDRTRVCIAILGTGPSEERLRTQARELGVADNFLLLGWQRDPENFLAALDIFVLPSRSEGMSNVVLEAMASGLPVVCAALDAHREVFEPGREGLVVEGGEAEWCSELERLSGDAALRDRLSAAAREKILAAFSLPKMVSAYAALYTEVLQVARKTSFNRETAGAGVG